MQFTIQNKTGNLALALRRASYHYLGSQGEEMNFVRPLGGAPYPRFHLYLKENKATKEVACSLHLDQKKPSYKGTSAHSGEYDTDLVEQEAQRIKTALSS